MKYLVFLYLCLSISLQDSLAQPDHPNPNNWKHFSYDDLVKQQANLERPYLRFLDEASMSMGLYVLPAGKKDNQQPHQLDEVYLIKKGRAKLIAGNDTIPVRQGSIAYVKAEVGHRFIQIEENLEVLVIFSKTSFNPADKDWMVWEMEDVIKKKKNDENVWNKFLDVATMRLGIYLLPKSLGGDQTLTHKVDEVNIVMKGKAKFSMDQDEIEVGPGSVVWVRQGIGHRFHALDQDFEVLILFVK